MSRRTSASTQLRESPVPVKVVGTEEAQLHSSDLGRVLAAVEGVSIRRNGGLGSSSRLSLDGLTDGAVRLFLDGLPLSFSGFGTGIANVPVAWIERVDVYRGLVPIALGADALGGAIDLISTPDPRGTRAHISYSLGSFGTYQVAADARTHQRRSGVFVHGSAFHDYSRNDYGVDVQVADLRGRLRSARVRRFHDRYRGRGAALEAGVVNRPYAKRLLLRLFATDFDQQIQHNVNMTVPYGQVRSEQSTLGGTLRFEHPRLLGQPLGVTAVAGYAHRTLGLKDTSPLVYDWFGDPIFERAAGSGELERFASDVTFWEHQALLRTTLAYRFTDNHSAQLSIAPDYTTRTGRERLRLRSEQLDPASAEPSVVRIISGLSYHAATDDDRLENQLFAKHYLYLPRTEQVRTFDNTVQRTSQTTSRFGAGNALRVRLVGPLIGKLSYEAATRLPTPDELFGDGVQLSPNLALSPETSHNVNVSLSLFEQPLGDRAGVVDIEANGALRETRDMIVKLIDQDNRHSIHQNVLDARTFAFTAALRWISHRRFLTLSTNATVQDQRNVSTRGPHAPFSGQRIPNRPWLFANALAQVRIPGLFVPNGTLTASWDTRYIREFLPGWEDTTSADDTRRIPDQLVHTLTVLYELETFTTVQLALDLINLTDARAFDTLGVQKPGRAIYFKISTLWDRDPRRQTP